MRTTTVRAQDVEGDIMAEMTNRERVLSVLAGEIPGRVPFVEAGIDFPFMCKLLGREVPPGRFFDSGEYETAPMDFQVDVNELLHRDNLKFDLQLPIPAVKTPGADQILFFGEGKLLTRDDLENLTFPDTEREEVLAPLREFVENRGDFATVLSTRVGVSATYLAIGMEHFHYELMHDPEFVGAVMSRYADFACRVVRVAADMGFDIIWTSDDIAGKIGTLWSPAMLREIFLPHMRRFADAVREAGVSWVFHSDGDLTSVLPDLVELGITGLNPVAPGCMDMAAIREEYPDLVLSGNVDVDMLSRATPAEVRERVRELVAQMGPSGRYFMSSGNSIASYCDVENVLAMGDAVLEFGKYPIGV